MQSLKRASGLHLWASVPQPKSVSDLTLSVVSNAIQCDLVWIEGTNSMTNKEKLDGLLEIVNYARTALGLDNENITIKANGKNISCSSRTHK
jgi:hypothetical protein